MKKKHPVVQSRAGRRNFMVIDPDEGAATLRALSSPARVQILKLLHRNGPLNINEISDALGFPQSSVSANVQALEDGGLVECTVQKARKGSQKICRSTVDEVVVFFKEELTSAGDKSIEVSMPLGLYTSCEVTAPCGLCSTEGIIGLLDVPDYFLDPGRMNASLLWFTKGYVEYQFPNNARQAGAEIEAVEFSLELSSEVPGTSADWPSDITVWINEVEIGTWTSPGDFGDKRGTYTPGWWKLKGSQYGKLKTWRVSRDGAQIDGVRISGVTVSQLDMGSHHSIRLRVGVKDDAKHPGGINIFGRGFGNYDQDIVLRLYPKA